MRPCLFSLLILLSAPAAAEGLRSDEAAFSEQLRRGVVPPMSRPESARVSAARGVVALAQGRTEEAARLFETAGELASDCALRARMAELGRGDGCPSLRAGHLDPALLEPPTAFLIVAAREDETGSAFPAAVLAIALKALAPAGGLSLESTADRFRITGSAALEGTWYLDDRLLLAARPAPGRGSSEAGEALAAFLALRPTVAEEEPLAPMATTASRPTAPASVEAHGLVIELPSSWSGRSESGAWLAPGASASDAFPPRAGAVAVKPRTERPELKRRRNPLARRKPTGGTESQDLAALPAGAQLLGSRTLSGDTRATELEWRPAAGGDKRLALVRAVPVAGREVLVVAHLGEDLTREEALRLLGGTHAVRP